MKRMLKTTATMSCMTLSALLLGGCSESTSGQNARTDQSAQLTGDSESQAHEHGGWWCAEHGVPEEECSICSDTAAEKFQVKGDWCEEHGRAKSQCFICDPSRAEKFAALYEAKYGKQPPQPTE